LAAFLGDAYFLRYLRIKKKSKIFLSPKKNFNQIFFHFFGLFIVPPSIYSNCPQDDPMTNITNYTIAVSFHKSRELGGVVSVVRSASIVEVQQRSQRSVTGWVTKTLNSRASSCFGRHVKPLVPAVFAVHQNPQIRIGPVWWVKAQLPYPSIKKASAPAVGTRMADDDEYKESDKFNIM
jgi:hypothetical protein